LRTTPRAEKEALLGPVGETEVQKHLEVIDSTIEKVSHSDMGICEICQGTIETELLEMDYTCCYCLDHYSAEDKRKLEFELELAQTAQKSLLPQQVPDRTGIDTAAFSRPTQVISGDYFDYFDFKDGCQGLTIVDVEGHGISASLPMASVQALLRTLVPDSVSPAQVTSQLQRLMIHNIRFTSFVTLFLASFNPDTRSFTYCNAGHNPPLLYRGNTDNETIQWLMPNGPAIGLVEEFDFQENRAQLEPGDTIILYTDGITEAANPKGEDFGWERLLEAARRTAGSSAKNLLDTIRRDLTEFTGGEPLADDATIMVFKIEG
jgi:sigma-B regulation protein RsbU (phosphoserine phosphatase)